MVCAFAAQRVGHTGELVARTASDGSRCGAKGGLAVAAECSLYFAEVVFFAVICNLKNGDVDFDALGLQLAGVGSAQDTVCV